MQKLPIYIILFVYLLTAVVAGCKEEETPVSQDPSELTVALNLSDEDEGLLTVTASALNTSKYQLLLGFNETLLEENTSGNFSYVFEKSGTYLIQVRAYGTSGRYIKEEIQLEVLLASDAVTLQNGYVTPEQYEGYTLVWNDEFNDNEINTNDWTFEMGDGCPDNCGWGNNELQYYRRENAWEKDSVLTIEARKENFGGKMYTSTRMITQQKQSFQYGRIDIRALLPQGQGIWPALWMLGEDINSVGWPKCGEIDIMEMVGGEGSDNTVHGTVHYDINGNHVYHGGHKSLASGIYADKYHVFSILWDKSSIKWYVDDAQFYTTDISSSDTNEFHQKFFFIFNIAVGGNWPGSPDATTSFPQQMKVDYIRVFQAD